MNTRQVVLVGAVTALAGFSLGYFAALPGESPASPVESRPVDQQTPVHELPVDTLAAAKNTAPSNDHTAIRLLKVKGNLGSPLDPDDRSVITEAVEKVDLGPPLDPEDRVVVRSE